MKIELVTPQGINRLRSRLPLSTFMDETFDEYILGVHQETGSIIYNLYGVIHELIKSDYPDLKDQVESDEWFDAYDEINERLCFSNMYYELDALVEDTLEIQNKGGSVSSTLTGDLDLINCQGDKRVLDILPDQDS